MPFTTKRQAISLAADEKQRLESLRRSRSGEKGEVLHAGILLDLAGGMSDGSVARSNDVNRHTVALCARKFLQFGLEAALGELARPGKGGGFRMTRLPGYSIAPARNRKNWATRTNSGPIHCCRNTSANTAWTPVTPA